VVRGAKRLEVEVDEEATAKELTSPILYGRKVKKGKPGQVIEFIGPKGKVIEQSNKAKASCPVNLPYLRCKVTRRVKNKNGDLLEYYAWIQPVFTDGRVKSSK
jgi:hypothetical protein